MTSLRVFCKKLNGYWFDTVLHLLHVADAVTLKQAQAWLGDMLEHLDRVAWIEMPFGRVRYPLQQNLYALPVNLVVDCLDDLARVAFRYKEYNCSGTRLRERLVQCFGQGLCELFFFPYNEKLWKRSLDSLPAEGFAWTIPRPSFREVLQGAFSRQDNDHSYNSDGWYPCPPANARLRGMENLSAAMARHLPSLETRCNVRRIDPKTRQVTADTPEGTLICNWEEGVVSTIPLPKLAKITVGLPVPLREAAHRLNYMRVIYLAFRIHGPRPSDRDHWHYYPDPKISFNRLVYMYRFDPFSAPPDGWGVMAEITERADGPRHDREALLRRTTTELVATRALPANCEIIGSHVIESEYGYVVFDDDREEIVARLQEYFVHNGIDLIGRYGRWEYTSMAQVLRQGNDWAQAKLQQYLGGENL